MTLFREAGPGDFENVLRLYRQLHPEEPVLYDGSDAAAFAQILGSAGLHLFVLEVDGVVVATTYLNVIPNLTRSASPYAVIENVVVEETLRGTGLGKQIMAGTLRAAWDAGCYKAMLMTGSRKPATHAFYRACGFSPDAKTAYLVQQHAHQTMAPTAPVTRVRQPTQPLQQADTNIL
ncbi:GNAT family N-acetyltransferase [Actinacidiphila soli]|uniref:GNAT family N-acetyltransferase n=1 Tax=Actinacidiphila soli TaxID=2487275 RepID=UPI0019D037E5|nr:GNAT family N-acetyltransferase [Actinacidiphila soli]